MDSIRSATCSSPTTLCPIAYFAKHQPHRPAIKGAPFGEMSYRQLDQRIHFFSKILETIPTKTIAFIPQIHPDAIALFFAIWRIGKSAYPLSHRLPHATINKRLLQTEAHLFEWSNFPQPSQEQRQGLSQNQRGEQIDLDRIATLIETSSSSKIACHTFRSHQASALSMISALKITEKSAYCLNLPLSHVAGIAILLRTFSTGGVVFLNFDPERVTHISMVPTQLFRFMKQSIVCHKLQCLLVGGGALSPLLKNKALALKLPLFVSYGMTEACSTVALATPEELAREPSTILGILLPHIRAQIAAQSGELLLKGKSLLSHYVGGEKITGWFPTKDRVRLISQENTKNRLKMEIVGRIDRQFVSGGENIQPEEIERALVGIPQIIEARVEGYEDPEFGTCPKAKITLDGTITLEEIRRHLFLSLPSFKIPKKLEILQGSKLSKVEQNGLG